MISTTKNRAGFSILMLAFLYIIFLFLYIVISNSSTGELNAIYSLMNFVSLLLLSYILYSLKKEKIGIFSPYGFFIFFMILFNLGQSVMWGIGIHYTSEISTSYYFRNFSTKNIVLGIFISQIMILFTHTGALIFNRSRNLNEVSLNQNQLQLMMKIFGVVLFLISTPITLFRSYQFYSISQIYGYSSIYYGNYIEQGGILLYIEFLFLPSLVLLLIGFWKKKIALILVIATYISYFLINLFAGDRGSWLYKGIILFWLIFYIYQYKIRIKSIIIGILALFFMLPFINVIIENRNNVNTVFDGNNFSEVYSIDNIKESFISPIFEMGKSMRVQIVVLSDELYSSWSYGNTYLAGLLGMVLPRVKTWFGFPDFYLENWYSQTYLNLNNYGEGFTNISEALLNFGPYLGVIFMGLYGFLIGSQLIIKKKKNVSMLKLFVVTTTFASLISSTRGSLAYSLRSWFWGTVFICIVLVISTILTSRTILVYKHER